MKILLITIITDQSMKNRKYSKKKIFFFINMRMSQFK